MQSGRLFSSRDPTALFSSPFFCYIGVPMSEIKMKAGVFEIICPCCRSVLWVDGISREIVKTEKQAARKIGSLDDLLEKEKKRQNEFERKFEATAELERQKKEKAKEAFEKALDNVDKED